MSVRGYVRCSNRIDKPLKYDRKWERYVSFTELLKLLFSVTTFFKLDLLRKEFFFTRPDPKYRSAY